MKRQRKEKKMAYTYANTPIGKLLLLAVEHNVVGLYAVLSACCPAIENHWMDEDSLPCFQAVKQQLAHYLAGKRAQFMVDHRLLEGTALQKEVWKQLATIPYGEQISYKPLAERTLYPSNKSRSLSCGEYPLLVVLPCPPCAEGGMEHPEDLQQG